MAAAFIAGLGLARIADWPSAWILGVGLACALVSLAGRRLPPLGLLAVIGLWMCAGLLRQAQWMRLPAHHVARHLQAGPSDVAVQGIVVDDPVEPFSPGEPERHVVVIRAQHARRAGAWQPITGLIRAKVQGPHPRLAYGDEVLLEGRWSVVPSPGNPGQFDWRAALARQRIHALLSVKPSGGLVVLREGQGAWWMAAMARVRRNVERLLDRAFSARHAGLLRSLLLGQRVALDEDLQRAFLETGTIHLLVISGFNVGLIACMLEWFLRLLGCSLRPRLILSAACLLGYWMLTGMQPPVTRATLMAWMVLGALGMDRVINWPNLVAAAALAIVLVQPSQLWEPSFQLSFGAVISLMVLARPMQQAIAPRLPLPEPAKRYVALSLASTAAIWIGLWPVLAWYFHLVAPISVIANLLLAPLVSLLVAAGTALAFLGLAVEPLLLIFRGGLGGLLDLAMAVVTTLHRVPGGYWTVGHPAWGVIAGYYALLLLSMVSRRLKLAAATVAACWLLGAALWIWLAVAAVGREASWLEVTLLDVGHGDAIAIQTPGRQRLLVDAGGRDAGQFTVAPFLRHRGWSELDALVVTHADEDHLGGALAVMDAARVRQLWTNGFVPDTDTARRLFAEAARRGLSENHLAAGQRLTGDPRLDMVVLHPPASGVPGFSLGANENSIVIRLAYDQVSVLLCGDVDNDGVAWVARWKDRARSDVLQVPHHGSRLGPWGRELFARVSPRLAVISVGRLHGLPADETLRDVLATGARTVMTREAGAVTVRTDGRRLIVIPFRS